MCCQHETFISSIFSTTEGPHVTLFECWYSVHDIPVPQALYAAAKDLHWFNTNITLMWEPDQSLVPLTICLSHSIISSAPSVLLLQHYTTSKCFFFSQIPHSHIEVAKNSKNLRSFFYLSWIAQVNPGRDSNNNSRKCRTLHHTFLDGYLQVKKSISGWNMSVFVWFLHCSGVRV